MFEGHPLRDATAHRVSENMRGGKAERVHESDCILRKKARRITAPRRRGRARAAVIECKNRVAPDERVDELCWPCRTWISRSRDEDDGYAVAPKLVCDGMAVDQGRASRLDDDGGHGVHSVSVNTRGMWFKR